MKQSPNSKQPIIVTSDNGVQRAIGVMFDGWFLVIYIDGGGVVATATGSGCIGDLRAALQHLVALNVDMSTAATDPRYADTAAPMFSAGVAKAKHRRLALGMREKPAPKGGR
jgi:hypothetical protein